MLLILKLIFVVSIISIINYFCISNRILKLITIWIYITNSLGYVFPFIIRIICVLI